MRRGIKCLALLFLSQALLLVLVPVALTMTIKASFVFPMLILSLFTSTLALLVFLYWIKGKDILVVTDDTIIRYEE